MAQLSSAFSQVSIAASLGDGFDQSAPADEQNHRRGIDHLVEKAASGCQDAFGQLAEYFYPRLVSFLFKRTGHLQDAEDIAADTFARAWRQLDKYDRKYQFSTWIYTIARRLAIDFHRREKRVPKGSSETQVTDNLVSRDAPVLLDEHNIWQKANRILSPTSYEVIWLKYGEELSIVEISAAMGKSQVSVRVALHRARKQLEKELGTH